MHKPLRWLVAAALGLGLVGPVSIADATEVDGAAETGDVTGTVKDTAGGILIGAQVIVLTAQRAVVATTTTDQRGTFKVTGLPDGQYLVIFKFKGLAERQAAVTVAGTATPPGRSPPARAGPALARGSPRGYHTVVSMT